MKTPRIKQNKKPIKPFTLHLYIHSETKVNKNDLFTRVLNRAVFFGVDLGWAGFGPNLDKNFGFILGRI